MANSKYIVTIVNGLAENRFETNSRDSVNHLNNHGGDRAVVENKSGKTVSMARRGEDGKPYRCELGDSFWDNREQAYNRL